MDTYPDYLCDFKAIAYFNCSYIIYDNEIQVEPITNELPKLIDAAKNFEDEVEGVLWSFDGFEKVYFCIVFVFILLLLIFLKITLCKKPSEVKGLAVTINGPTGRGS